MLTLVVLTHLGQAASFNTPLPLQVPLRLRNSVNLPAAPVIRPVLTGVIPARCARPGRQLVLTGRDLGQRGARQLVMDTGEKQVTLTIKAWTTTRITSQLPKRINHRGKVEIGIRSGEIWLGTPLPVVICRAAASTQAPAPVGVPAVQAPPVATPAPTNSPPPPGNDLPPAADSSAISTPPAQPASSAAEEWEALPEEQAPAPVSQPIGGGDLLGAALPPVPEGLQLASVDQAAREYAPHELMAVTASMEDAKRLAQVMGTYRARVIRRRRLGSLGMVISTFRLSDQVSVAETLVAVRGQYPDLWIDLNHYFRPQAANNQRIPLYRAIGWQLGQTCGRGLRVGILDGPVNMSHPALSGQAVVQKRLFARGRTPATTRHATAVASLLLGNPRVMGLGGVISEATLDVGVVMQVDDKDDSYSTAENLLSGLDWLLGQQVQVISLSLGGPRNALLEVALQRTQALGVSVVAAAGNGGADAPPSYPAAQSGVVAVTSVDSDGQVAEDANRGDYIDLAAPGVDVWVATGKDGGRYTSGTSMAAPLVAAALAQLGGGTAQVAQLFRQARDRGKPGRDPVYGWGLLQFPPCTGTGQ